MGRARVWVSAGCAIALVLAGAALGAVVDPRTRGAGGCATTTAANPDTGKPRPDDVLLTEEPWDGAVSVHIGQRLVVVLADPGVGGWLAPTVDGSAARLVATVGANNYRCQRQPPAAVLAIVLAETSGTVILSARTDVACRHARPECGVPDRTWRRTVTVIAA